VRDRRTRLRREARHEQLLAAAAALLAERGPEKLTMEAVAAASRVDKAIPYRHFANRDALLIALYERAIAEFDARIVAVVDAADSLEAEIRGIVEVWLDDLEARGVVSSIHQLAAAEGRLEARRRRRLEESARWLAGRLRAHRPLAPRQAAIAAAVLMSGTIGLLAAWRMTGSSRRTAVDAFVRMALGAVEALARAGRRR
jgi:AcrR family transcriptional regulator